MAVIKTPAVPVLTYTRSWRFKGGKRCLFYAQAVVDDPDPSSLHPPRQRLVQLSFSRLAIWFL